MEILVTLAPIILMFVIFYFLLIRPQQKKQKQVKEMQAAIQIGDPVVTIDGMHGVIDSLAEETIMIATTGGTKLTYDRAAIRDVVNVD